MDIAKKYCSKCQRDVRIECFEGSFKTCNVCREKARRQYHNDPEKCAERKKQFKENNPEKYKEQRKKWSDTQKEKIFHEVMVCPICHYSIKKYKKAQHEKSQTHQNNLKQKSETKEEEK